MWNQIRSASGYSAIFIVPTLLLAGMWLAVPSLAFAAVMLVFPLTRGVFGSVAPDGVIYWREDIAIILDRLPLLYAVSQPFVILFVILHLAAHQGGATLPLIALGLSLWMVMLFATCVGHDLIHRRNARQALVGHCVAGLAGYPVLAQEHLVHHARSGDTHGAEWPRLDESVWLFALRRASRILRDAYSPGAAFWRLRAQSRNLTGLRIATALSLATGFLFAYAGGYAGALLYLAVVVGVIFGVQVITYIQHWGLGDDHLGSRASRGYAWEDDCRFQAWTTLSISLHDAHHRSSHWPFYRVTLTSDSPRLPAGYVVLMVLCLFPRLWRRVMRPVLEHWKFHPHDPHSPGRKLTCFAAYGADVNR
jgi:fatty acid desaturase